MQIQDHPGHRLPWLELLPDGHREGTPYPLVVCLHGFGADRHDLASLADAIDPDRYVYALPDGPLSAFDGADTIFPAGRAWYERGGESPRAVDAALSALGFFLDEVLARHQPGPGRVVLLGFSQGGAMALRYGLPRPERVAGLAVLSGSLRRLDDLLPSLPAERTQP